MRSRDPYIGRIFNGYQIKSRIACGSFGCVYLAQHILLLRYAAIKLMHTAYLHSSREQKRFLQEARFLEVLKHPHILDIYDAGVDNGLPFLVTEYAAGGSLRDLLKRWSPHPLPVNNAISILSQIGYALHYAHQQNILHHDLKPANILFNYKGEVLLADFGIAIVQANATHKRPTASIGTPAYMAPEQFKGEVGHKSDQYSLGCLAYELVTGRLPFIAPNDVAMGFTHLQAIPIPPTQLNPFLPLHIEQAVLKAMEKRSVNRYADIRAFITALNTPSSQAPIRREPQTSLRNAEQWLSKAFTFRRLKRYEEALAAYDQAIQLNPYCVEAYKDKGSTLYELRRYEEALAAFVRVTQLASKDADAWHSKGNVLYKLRRYNEALAAYTQAIQLHPENAVYHYNMGNILQFLGRFEEAYKAFATAKRLGYV